MRWPVFLLSWLLTNHRPAVEVLASLVTFVLDVYKAALPAQTLAEALMVGLCLPAFAERA